MENPPLLPKNRILEFEADRVSETIRQIRIIETHTPGINPNVPDSGELLSTAIELEMSAERLQRCVEQLRTSSTALRTLVTITSSATDRAHEASSGTQQAASSASRPFSP